MGSRVSSVAPGSTLEADPHLPDDVLFEIISHLNPDRDRQTFLSLSLCCTTLRNASQRVLFSNVRRGWSELSDLYRILQSHTRFLQTVISSPDRLALYVRSYSQVGLALEPSFATDKDSPAQRLDNKKDRVYLWELTRRALPLMTNLKSFYFKPSWDHPSAPSLLQECTFQLQSFTWMGKGNEQMLFSEFLPRQPGLLHLDINSLDIDDRDILPDHLCPSLISVSCPFSAFATIAQSRPITAFHIINSIQDAVRPVHVDHRPPAERSMYLTAIQRLHYLHLWSLSKFLSLISGIVFTNVSVLELTLWQVNAFSPEASILALQFPKLRVLLLWDHYPSEANASMRHEAVTGAFAQCPKLEYVMFSSRIPNRSAWKAYKSDRGIVEDEVTDEQTKEFDRWMWWRNYVT